MEEENNTNASGNNESRKRGIKRKKPTAAATGDADGSSNAAKAPAPTTAANTTPTVVKKRGGSKPLLKDSGIGRVDNQLRSSLFSVATPINQKNYYTEYLRRDEQLMAYGRPLPAGPTSQKRALNDRSSLMGDIMELTTETGTPAETPGDTTEIAPLMADDSATTAGTGVASAIQGPSSAATEAVEPELAGSKTIVIHPGSRNLRLGLASHAYPKSVPNVIAHRVANVEHGNGNGNGNGNGSELSNSDLGPPSAYNAVFKDLRERMRFYKRRIVPNSHDLVVSFNSRSVAEIIPDHNDPYRIEWTVTDGKYADNDDNSPPSYITGEKALRIPPNSTPSYRLKWPLVRGHFNESDYQSPQQILGDISLILESALSSELHIPFSHYHDYNVVLLIPDLYDKYYVSSMIELLLSMGFNHVGILQESMGATFGAGVSTACVVDVGAQKVSVACVEEGMCFPESRVHMAFGGDDVTRALTRLLLMSSFPYKEINLSYAYDWALAEELKVRFSTLNDADVAVQLYSFYQRAPGRPARKFQFKTFDEVMLGPMGLFYPELFEKDQEIKPVKLLFGQSRDIYDGRPNDPISLANTNIQTGRYGVNRPAEDVQSSIQSQQGTPAPNPSSVAVGGASQNSSLAATTAIPASQNGNPASNNSTSLESSSNDGVCGIEHAIIESISIACARGAAGGDRQVFYENLMIVGGGAAKFQGLEAILSDRIGIFRAQAGEAIGEVGVMPPAREMDPQVITWKGGSVFAKLKIVNEVWIGRKDWDMLGSRCLQHKTMFVY